MSSAAPGLLNSDIQTRYCNSEAKRCVPRKRLFLKEVRPLIWALTAASSSGPAPGATMGLEIELQDEWGGRVEGRLLSPEIEKLARRCANEVHASLKFIGDSRVWRP